MSVWTQKKRKEEEEEEYNTNIARTTIKWA